MNNMIIETAMTMMAKPFIDGVVKEMIIPKMKAFCDNLAEGVAIDCIPKTEHFQEYLFSGGGLIQAVDNVVLF